jgi:hypothetical protein
MRAALSLALMAVALSVAAPLARADGDPASDVLYVGDVFLPYDQIAKPPLSAKLVKAAVAAANKAGYPIRAALIASPYDLGTANGLFEKPREYARFLGLELRLVYRGVLLIVMPNGFGVYHEGKPTDAERRALLGLEVARGTEGLNRAAVAAVVRLAEAAGHKLPITVPSAPAGSSGGGWSDRYTIALAGGLVLLLIAGSRVPGVRRRFGAR